MHVPYKGLPEALTGVVSGQVSIVFGAIEGVLPLVRQGRLRALAVTAAQRFAPVPDVPTMLEEGVNGFTVRSFEGVVAPIGTPPAIVTRLNAAINASVAAADMQARFAALGLAPSSGTPQEFAAFFATETRKWAGIVAAAHIGAE